MQYPQQPPKKQHASMMKRIASLMLQPSTQSRPELSFRRASAASAIRSYGTTRAHHRSRRCLGPCSVQRSACASAPACAAQRSRCAPFGLGGTDSRPSRPVGPDHARAALAFDGISKAPPLFAADVFVSLENDRCERPQCNSFAGHTGAVDESTRGGHSTPQCIASAPKLTTPIRKR